MNRLTIKEVFYGVLASVLVLGILGLIGALIGWGIAVLQQHMHPDDTADLAAARFTMNVWIGAVGFVAIGVWARVMAWRDERRQHPSD